ncbi:MAG: ABC transporter permease [Acaryochloridaceae cyanobacterium SU_2_1]|nr:ABC transporter permease [Acaryochloridaceae cyanobacterium SU_2_1]NJM95587.1 ABC transporter permease [Acaryochloridaceae cyanobacterium CSU_5_19]
MILIFNNIVAIYRKELQGYFKSPFTYVIAGVFWFLACGLFARGVQFWILRAQELEPFGQSVDVPQEVLKDFLSGMWLLALLILPSLSMGLYAEERRQRTLELLATSPITNWAVALGKLMAVWTFFLSLMLPVAVFEVLVLINADPPLDKSVFGVGHLGLLLMAAAILSLGLFVSSLTDSSILAIVLTYALILILSLLFLLGESWGEPWISIFDQLSLIKHYVTLTQGVFDSSSLVLFASYIVLGLFLTAQSIDLFRFQRH